ncbi:MAG: redoxin domain-containing protein [Nitrospirota bacterium]|nr:redoxin domain-containing protein [Nitrospirota bacterium]
MTGRYCIRAVTLLLVLFLISACDRASFNEQKPAVGDPAPNISLADLSGRMLRLADSRGKVVLLNFWASWCPPCKDEMPGFQKVYLSYEDKGFTVIAVAINEVTLADVKALGILFPVLVANDRVKREYGDIAHPPVSFLIGKDGKILKKVKGVYSEDELRKDVQQALR